MRRLRKRAKPPRRRACRGAVAPVALPSRCWSPRCWCLGGAPVGKTYSLLLRGGFGSVFAWSETLTAHAADPDRARRDG